MVNSSDFLLPVKFQNKSKNERTFSLDKTKQKEQRGIVRFKDICSKKY